jgi:hypothetical protein
MYNIRVLRIDLCYTVSLYNANLNHSTDNPMTAYAAVFILPDNGQTNNVALVGKLHF